MCECIITYNRTVYRINNIMPLSVLSFKCDSAYTAYSLRFDREVSFFGVQGLRKMNGLNAV